MCCCTTHLHAWSICALIECAEKQKINIAYSDYTNFFEVLMREGSFTYIQWSCTPDKKTICNQISKIWDELHVPYWLPQMKMS